MIRTYEIIFRVARELDVQVQDSALIGVVSILEHILGDDLLDHKLLSNGIEVVATEEKMDNLVEKSIMGEVCVVTKKEVVKQ